MLIVSKWINFQTPWLQISGLQYDVAMLFKPPKVWYFVKAAPGNGYSRAPGLCIPSQPFSWVWGEIFQEALVSSRDLKGPSIAGWCQGRPGCTWPCLRRGPEPAVHSNSSSKQPGPVQMCGPGYKKQDQKPIALSGLPQERMCSMLFQWQLASEDQIHDGPFVFSTYH
jgi:hypothetical protein